jgi:hypothetical protein
MVFERRVSAQVFQAARNKEEKMRKIISSLVTLASASGVSQERALFMEVATNEVERMIDKMNTRGGMPPAVQEWPSTRHGMVRPLSWRTPPSHCEGYKPSHVHLSRFIALPIVVLPMSNAMAVHQLQSPNQSCFCVYLP